MEHAQKRGHKLEHAWVLWTDAVSGSSAKAWGDAMQPVCTVERVEEFWALFDRVPRASELGVVNLYLFKRGIEPRWEHAANEHGGRWSVVVSPSSSHNWRSKDALDALWLNTLLAVVGEQLGSNVCGAALSIKSGHARVSIWLAEEPWDAVLATGIDWKKVLGIPDAVPVNWQLHGDNGSPRTRL